MAKPWAKAEVGYMRHQKFLALNGNAIALWHEGKDYCAEYHTDGLVPLEAIKGFRFRGAKSLALLTTSCGLKPGGTPYAPLWESHEVGYQMHDYLDHNDCRDDVLARLEDAEDVAELRRVANRKRQAEYRTKRKAEIEAMKASVDVTPIVTPVTRDVTPTCSTPTVSVSVSATEIRKNTETRAPRMASLHHSHIKHAHCGRVCLHGSLFSEFVRRRNHPNADAEIRVWALEVEAQWADSPDEPGDAFDFWRARYGERWPPSAAAAPKAANAGPAYKKVS